MSGETERANYITCPKGHKVYVIWSPRFKKFGFTCDECDQHSFMAASIQTGHLIAVKVVRRMRAEDYGRMQ
jgi:hypothetical protein